jgi:hypothetical protein
VSIATVFAHVNCKDLETSAAWYEKLFDKPPIRRPSPKIAEWQFSDSAEVQVCEEPTHAGHSTLSLGVLPLRPVQTRLQAAGLLTGPIEETDGYYAIRLRDPDDTGSNSDMRASVPALSTLFSPHRAWCCQCCNQREQFALNSAEAH